MKTIVSIKKRKLNNSTKDLTNAQISAAASKGSYEISSRNKTKSQQEKVVVEEYTEWE